MNSRYIFAAAALLLGMIVAGVLVLAVVLRIFDRNDPAGWRELSDFSRIELAAVGDMSVTSGERASITVEGRPRDLNRLQIYVEGETLHIAMRRGMNFFQPFPQNIDYFVVVPELQALQLSGAARVEIDRVETPRFELDVSGVGTVDIASMQVARVEVDFSGGGHARLRGQAADQSISISGAGAYVADEMRTETARVRVSGAGSAGLWVTDALDVDISGVGSVRYYGDPIVTQNVSGLGTVNALGSKEE